MQPADETNPKDLLGVKKLSLTKVPASAVAHCATAMMNGAEKYGAFNWRSKPVRAEIYIDAALRHLNQWFDGEEIAEDSGVHHLAHAMACCAILLDAQECGALVDDRPPGGGSFNKLLKQVNERIAARKERVNESATTASPGTVWALEHADELREEAAKSDSPGYSAGPGGTIYQRAAEQSPGTSGDSNPLRGTGSGPIPSRELSRLLGIRGAIT